MIGPYFFLDAKLKDILSKNLFLHVEAAITGRRFPDLDLNLDLCILPYLEKINKLQKVQTSQSCAGHGENSYISVLMAEDVFYKVPRISELIEGKQIYIINSEIYCWLDDRSTIRVLPYLGAPVRNVPYLGFHWKNKDNNWIECGENICNFIESIT